MESPEERERRGQKIFEEILTIKISNLVKAINSQKQLKYKATFTPPPLPHTHTHNGSYTKVHIISYSKPVIKHPDWKSMFLPRNKGENDNRFLIVNNTSEKIVSNVFKVAQTHVH